MSINYITFIFFSIIFKALSHLNVPSVVLLQDKTLSEIKTKLELSNIFGDLIFTLGNQTMNWEYKDKGYVWNQYLNVNNIKIDSYSSILEVSDISYNILSDKEIMTGKNSLNIKFIFEYEAKTGIKTFFKGTGFIEVNLNKF